MSTITESTLPTTSVTAATPTATTTTTTNEHHHDNENDNDNSFEVTVDMAMNSFEEQNNDEEKQQQQQISSKQKQEQSKDTTLSTDDNDDDDEFVETHTLNHPIIGIIEKIYSGALLIFCIVIVSGAIFQKQTQATGESGLHPIVAFIVFWVLLLWLALMEGGLNCMVGLVPVDKTLYAESHPRTYACTSVAHKNGNLERFIVGRQYLDLMSVFMTSFMVSTIENASVFGFPQIVIDIFLSSGFAVILITIVIGQLIAQINSSACMLDFINNRVMQLTTYLALTVEASGILHAVYFVQIIIRNVTGNKRTGIEYEQTKFQKFTFWVRIIFSLAILLFAFVVTFKALFDGDTTMWESVPAYASVIIMFILLLIAGVMEALQIAFIAVVHMPEEILNQYPVAKRNCNFIFQGDNLQAFLVGRQILQTVIMFVFARILTLDPKNGNIFGVNDRVQAFFNTGILGALISTIVASLSWRVAASSFPLFFLNNFTAKPIIMICLWSEYTGICEIAWTLAKIYRKVFGLKKDKHYIGEESEIAAMNHHNNKDNTSDLNYTEQGSLQEEESSSSSTTEQDVNKNAPTSIDAKV